MDLTLLAGTLVSGILGTRWLRGARLPSRAGAALVGLWFLSFAPGLFQAAGSPYGIQKIATIYTFTLLSAVAPMVLLEQDRDAEKILNAMACFCLAITLSGLLGGARDTPEAQRLQAFGAGTISLGRATGLLSTYAALTLAGAVPWPGLTFGIMVLAGVTALFSGSRGPILAALAVVALVFGAGRARLAGNLPRLLAAGGLFLFLLAASLSLAPKGSLRRVQAFFHGQYGASEQYRMNALEACWDRVGDAPWGTRLGRLRHPDRPGAGGAAPVSPQPSGGGHPGGRLGVRGGHPPGAGRGRRRRLVHLRPAGWSPGVRRHRVLPDQRHGQRGRERQPSPVHVHRLRPDAPVPAGGGGGPMNARPRRMAVVTTAHPWGDPRVFERELAACLEWGVETHVFVTLDGLPPASEWCPHPRLVVHPLPVPRGRLARFRLALGVWRQVLRHGPFPLVHFHDPELVPAMALLAPGATGILHAL